MTLVIMAAGMGSRFGGLKQIEPVGPNGEFIIDYSIYDAKKAGFDKVVFIIKEENYDIFKETIGSRVDKYIDVEYVFQNNDNVSVDIPSERVKPLGTGHAILCCKDVVKENFAIVNADDFYGYDAYKTIAEFLSCNNDINNYAMVGYPVVNTLTTNGAVKRGVCKIEDGYLTGLTESSIELIDNTLLATSLETNENFTISKDGVVSMNMFGFTPRLFDYLETKFDVFLKTADLSKAEFLIPSVVNQLIDENKVKVNVLNTSAKWYGITYREDKESFVKEIEKMINRGDYPNNLWD